MTNNQSLDTDFAILLFLAPLYLAAFLGLAVVGALNDWRNHG